MFFSLFWQREGTKRDHVARSVSEGISTLRTELRDSLRSNRSSLLLRSRSQSLHSLASTFAIATIKAPPPTSPKGRRCAGISLAPSGRQIIGGTLSLIAFSDIVTTRHSSSKLASALAAPLIPATEPESHPCSSAADRGSSPR